MGAKDLNTLRGQLMMRHPPHDPIWRIVHYVDWLEYNLDVADGDDMFGSSGWRHYFRHPDAE